MTSPGPCYLSAMSKDTSISVDKIERLRTALIEGEQSGEPTPFDLDDFLDDMRRQRAKPR